MSKKIILKGITVVLLSMLASNSYAQINAEVSTTTSYDNNIYLTPDKISDFIEDAELRLGYFIKPHPQKSVLSLYNNFEYIAYMQYGEKNIFLNNLGAAYVHALGKDKHVKLYLGGNWFLRKNRTEYNYYDYNQIYMYNNWQIQINKTFLKVGYNFRYRDYAYLTDLSNAQHYLFLQLNHSFQTRTSIIFETDFGYKSFKGVETYSVITVPTGRGGRHTTTSQTTSETVRPSMSHIIILARVAQSITKKIGIYVQYKRQISLTDKTDYINFDSYSQNDELFDEPFSYSSSGVSSKLTFIFPKAFKMEISGYYTKKNYISEKAYISEDDTEGLGDIREDTKQGMNMNISKSFSPKNKHIQSIKTFLNYNYIYNQSNSYWYNYDNSTISFGLSFQF
ncbi:hypothetical protein LA303_05890 [Candidatus Sulfidibacterium hydrothermale]|uniref:hypothetical protein n=1 Tax=Candidatus Sulfidibacterium hydrothermale TaxID=2875962 RepID=UPI001F0B5CC4|nr:hypothetical protein [Candidatus Sulfidibacterium hydrothermale]UBM63497.1 hypothetical protein LA303_05890 [Candidatus Sulfidibacterium hydrothermale]